MQPKLYIAEKPSQANDIARVLGITKRGQGYLELEGGSVMTWAIGHVLRQAEPKEYSEAWAGSWNWSQLPMIPAEWKMVVDEDKKSQFKVIKELLKKFNHVVIATDAGREGELIGRELLEYCKFKGTVERFWVSTLVASDIKKALQNLKPGKVTEPLYEAAVARSHADFVWGYTLSRAATLAANTRESFPVGRVQTPVLAMVVAKDELVEKFEKRTYYELEAQVKSAGGQTFTMTHAPEESKRIYERAAAVKLQQQANAASGPLSVESKPGKESPPLPFNLSTLQREANKAFGFSADKTLKVAQALYDKKAMSYPRTDCSYYGESQKGEVEATLRAVAKTFEAAVGILRTNGIEMRTSVFDDSKLSDHHAIAPTTQPVDLIGDELKLFTLVAQRYLQVLSKDLKFQGTRVTMDANGVPFVATGRVVNFVGWKAIKLL